MQKKATQVVGNVIIPALIEQTKSKEYGIRYGSCLPWAESIEAQPLPMPGNECAEG